MSAIITSASDIGEVEFVPNRAVDALAGPSRTACRTEHCSRLRNMSRMPPARYCGDRQPWSAVRLSQVEDRKQYRHHSAPADCTACAETDVANATLRGAGARPDRRCRKLSTGARRSHSPGGRAGEPSLTDGGPFEQTAEQHPAQPAAEVPGLVLKWLSGGRNLAGRR